MIKGEANSCVLDDVTLCIDKLGGDGFEMVTEGVMEMAGPLMQFDRSQVALSIEVTVPGTGQVGRAKSIHNQVCTWWVLKEMPL